jgi:hypothetical protein
MRMLPLVVVVLAVANLATLWVVRGEFVSR